MIKYGARGERVNLLSNGAMGIMNRMTNPGRYFAAKRIYFILKQLSSEFI